jgi:hypothetical protein
MPAALTGQSRRCARARPGQDPVCRFYRDVEGVIDVVAREVGATAPPLTAAATA